MFYAAPKELIGPYPPDLLFCRAGAKKEVSRPSGQGTCLMYILTFSGLAKVADFGAQNSQYTTKVDAR